VLGHGSGDLAGYMMSRAALNRMEESGQGESAMADVARTGLKIAQIRMIVGGVVFVIALIVMAIIWSSAQSNFNNFNNNNGFNNSGFPGTQTTCVTTVINHVPTMNCG
jgi:hypothetical protein